MFCVIQGAWVISKWDPQPNTWGDLSRPTWSGQQILVFKDYIIPDVSKEKKKKKPKQKKTQKKR